MLKNWLSRHADALLVAPSAIALAIWCKYFQLNFVHPALVGYYPIVYWFVACVAMLLAFLAVLMPLRGLGRGLAVGARSLFLERACALVFNVFFLVWVGMPLRVACLVFFLLQSLLLATHLFRRRKGLDRRAFRRHACAFALILSTQAAFHGFLSPAVWRNPMLAYPPAEGPAQAASTLLFRIGYINAKRLDYSNFDSGFWGSVSHSPMSMESLVIPFIEFLLDVPTLSISDFHLLSLVTMFVVSVLASFAAYAYLYFALGVGFEVSVLGGFFFILLNQSFGEIHGQHFANFSAVYLFLPFAMLLFRLGVNRIDARFAFFSGISMALPFYVMAPHPDAVIHGTLFFFGYAAFLARRRYSKILIAAIIGFIGGAAQYLFPIFESVVRKELHVFGHNEEIFYFGLKVGFLVFLTRIILAGGLLFGLVAPAIKSIPRGSLVRRDLGYFLIIALSGLFFLICGQDGWVVPVLKKIHFPLNFIFVDRALTYVTFSVVFASLIGLDSIGNFRQVRWKPISLALASVLAMFVCTVAVWSREIPVSELLKPWISLPALVQLGLIVTVMLSAFMAVSDPRKRIAQGLVLALGAALIPISGANQPIRTGERVNNEKGCKPYLSLKAEAINARGLLFDGANPGYLRDRLKAFEDDLRGYQGPDVAELRLQYMMAQNPMDTTSVYSVPDARLPEMAMRVGALVDAFYLSRSGNCYFLQQGLPLSTDMPRVPVGYHDSVMFAGTQDLERILLAVQEPYAVLGLAQSLFMNNASNTVNQQFTTAFPPLHAIYLEPGNYRTEVGTYAKSADAFTGIRAVSEPIHRRLNNLSGIDVFGFRSKDFEALGDKSDLEVLNYECAERIKPQTTVVRDHRSRGLAYFADSVLNTESISNRFFEFKLPFSDASKAASYRELVDSAIKKLMGISTPRGVLLESGAVGLADEAVNAGMIHEKKLVGNKMAFRVSCSNTPCRLVVNMAEIAGWRAFMDGKFISIERANFAFLSVPVEKGEHLVWFEHRRDFAILGTLLTLFCLVLPWFRVRSLSSDKQA